MTKKDISNERKKKTEASRFQISDVKLWCEKTGIKFTKILQEFRNRLPSFPWLIMSPLSAPCLKLCGTMRELPFFTGGKYFYCKETIIRKYFINNMVLQGCNCNKT